MRKRVSYTIWALAFHRVPSNTILDPLREQDFKFTNEFNEHFTAFPTFSNVAHKVRLVDSVVENPYIPEMDPHIVLHA